MCGICGWVGAHAAIEPPDRARQAALAMASAIAHRGPDGGSAHEVGGEYATGWFGHRRLRVIDLTDAAAQPMVSAHRRAVLVFNGEIYNFRELRAQLAPAGFGDAIHGRHRGRPAGIRGVGLGLCETAGRNVRDRGVGRTPRGVWSSRATGPARSRCSTRCATAAWCSHPKSRRSAQMPDSRLEPDPSAFPEFLTSGYISAPATIYRDIAQLPPASLLGASARVTAGSILERWWSAAARRSTAAEPTARCSPSSAPL